MCIYRYVAVCLGYFARYSGGPRTIFCGHRNESSKRGTERCFALCIVVMSRCASSLASSSWSSALSICAHTLRRAIATRSTCSLVSGQCWWWWWCCFVVLHTPSISRARASVSRVDMTMRHGVRSSAIFKLIVCVFARYGVGWR